jgi:hypothetical protein
MASANPTPLPDITEGVNPVLGQFAEKLLFCGTVYPDGEDVH